MIFMVIMEFFGKSFFNLEIGVKDCFKIYDVIIIIILKGGFDINIGIIL